ncbi:uncharacterized protein LOC124165903 [Ischnura elegans]|uniref:uncharacterized protein LOC124165903 n=1 Tax=Ischnura elegans TaxID=197161 RepID=UPI001ED86F15|nr:uncharacterized protein LOC124165903 [Ischnura elegans]
MEGFYEKQKTYLRKINNSFINFKKEGATKMNRGSYNAEEVYLQRKGEFEEFLINLVSASSKSERNGENKTSHSEGDHLVRLPVPELPKFSGDFRNWETFRDLLKSMIIDRKDISQVAKLQYLLSCLSGEAADLVRTIPITEENFTLAWQSLQNYYENNRRITSAHLAALFDLKSMQNESASELRRIYAGTVNPLLSLEALRRPVCHWDDLIVFITERRLDPQTRRDWEIKLENSTAPPTYEMLKNFLKTKIMSLDSLESCGNKQSSGSPKGMQQRRQFHEKSGSYKSKSFHMGGSTVMKNPLCALCGRSHWLAYCETFRDKSVEQRKEFVLSKNLCFNCFGQHVLRNCISKKSCQVCHKKHHTFLHEPSTNSESSKNCVKNQSTSSFPVFTEESIERKLTNVIDSKPETVLLSTAWVKVQGPHGNVVLARALLDQCAQSSFITESLCQRLRLDKKSASVVVSGLGNSHHMKCKGSVSVLIKPRFMSTFSCHTEALVVPKVTLYKPSLLTRDNWPHLKELELADPKYFQAGQIDLLLGAAVHARVVEGRVVKGEANHPIAMATALGWILSGETNAVLPHTSAVFTIQQDDHEIHTALAKQKDVINLCMVGGFSLCKWHSNSSTLLQWLPQELLASEPESLFANDSIFAILGLIWQSKPALIEENIPTLKRWQMVQQMLQHYWRRWSREYLQSLQQRQKWATSTPNIKAGDLVIACNDNTPPARWQLARQRSLGASAEEWYGVGRERRGWLREEFAVKTRWRQGKNVGLERRMHTQQRAQSISILIWSSTNPLTPYSDGKPPKFPFHHEANPVPDHSSQMPLHSSLPASPSYSSMQERTGQRKRVGSPSPGPTASGISQYPQLSLDSAST